MASWTSPPLQSTTTMATALGISPVTLIFLKMSSVTSGGASYVADSATTNVVQQTHPPVSIFLIGFLHLLTLCQPTSSRLDFYARESPIRSLPHPPQSKFSRVPLPYVVQQTVTTISAAKSGSHPYNFDRNPWMATAGTDQNPLLDGLSSWVCWPPCNNDIAEARARGASSCHPLLLLVAIVSKVEITKEKVLGAIAPAPLASHRSVSIVTRTEAGRGHASLHDRSLVCSVLFNRGRGGRGKCGFWGLV